MRQFWRIYGEIKVPLIRGAESECFQNVSASLKNLGPVISLGAHRLCSHSSCGRYATYISTHCTTVMYVNDATVSYVQPSCSGRGVLLKQKWATLGIKTEPKYREHYIIHPFPRKKPAPLASPPTTHHSSMRSEQMFLHLDVSPSLPRLVLSWLS